MTQAFAFVFLGLLGTDLSAQIPASPSPKQAEFRKTSTTLLKSFSEQGFSKVGDKSIRSLLKTMNKTHWIDTGVFWLASGGARGGAANSVEENQVLFSIITTQAVSENTISTLGLQAFVLHEALGAAGIDDENYNATLGILLVGSKRDLLRGNKALRDHLVAQVAAARSFKKNRVYQNVDRKTLARNSSGGGTSVGSGGDIVTMALKLQLIEVASKKNILTLAFLKRVMALDVKIEYNALEGFAYRPGELRLAHYAWATSNRDYREAYQSKVLGHMERVLR